MPETYSKENAEKLSDEQCIALYLLLIDQFTIYETDDVKLQIELGRKSFECNLEDKKK